MNKTSFRQLAVSLLDDENGISSESFNMMQDYSKQQEFSMDDIFGKVDAADGRFFLPEDHGIVA